MKLATKLTALFLLLAIAPLALVGYLAYENGRRSIEQNLLNHLISTNILKEAEFDRWVEDKGRLLRALSKHPHLAEDIAALVSGDQADPGYQVGRRNILESWLIPFLEERGGFIELFVLSGGDGLILISTDEEQEGKYRESERFFVEGKRRTYVETVTYSLGLEQAIMHVSTPIEDKGGNLVAVLAGRLDLAEMPEIMKQRCDLIVAEETYLVNAFNFFVTKPRFGEGYALKQALHTEGVAACLGGEDGVGYYEDYRGVPVIGAYHWMEERELCILTEVDQAEAYAPIVALGKEVLGIGAGVALLAGLAGVFFARTVTHPVHQLVVGAEEIGRGNLDYRIETRSRDEVGQLAAAFNEMAANLSDSEENYRTLIGASPDTVVVTDLEGRITYVSPRGCKLYGVDSTEELLGQSAFDLIALEDRERAEANLQRTLSETLLEPTEYILLRKDGSRYFGELSAGLIRDAAGGPRGFVGIIRDVTGRKRAREARRRALAEALQAQEALQESEERYRTLVETMNEGLAAVDENGSYTYVNDKLCCMLGYSRGEMVGHPVIEFRDAASREAFREQMAARRRGEDAPYGATFLRKDGSTLHAIVSPRPLFGAQGNFRGSFAVITDITERKRAEEARRVYAARLEQSNRDLQDFAYVASHDLQEPLRKIRAFGDRLVTQYRGSLDERGRDYMDRMQSAAERMSALINDLLTFSRVVTHVQSFTPVDLAEVAREVLSDLEIRLERTAGRVEVGPLPLVEADGTQMRQLLQNLIGNALKFHREGVPPVVKVHGQRVEGLEGRAGEGMADGPYYQIVVEDNGIGFEMQFAGRLFRPFQRLHGREEYEGSGMGLAICRRVVERHGGAITVESAPGQGATFIVTLPVYQRLADGESAIRD